MGGLCNRAWHVEVEDGLRPGPHFCHAPPPGVTASGCTVAVVAIADEINVRVWIVRRPVPLKVVKKSQPIVGQLVLFEIL
jgi:hypothetical protein